MHLLCIFTIYRYVYQCQVDMDVSHDRTETRCHRFFHDTPNRGSSALEQGTQK